MGWDEVTSLQTWDGMGWDELTSLKRGMEWDGFWDSLEIRVGC